MLLEQGLKCKQICVHAFVFMPFVVQPLLVLSQIRVKEVICCGQISEAAFRLGLELGLSDK